MVTEISGNIFDCIKDGGGILCHQTNYQGVMGAGIALAIRQKLLTGRQYQNYTDLCMREGRKLLGKVAFQYCRDDVTLANCFCQDEWETDGALTLYAEMYRCFQDVRREAVNGAKRVYIPYKMGCGIAGGDWSKVCWIINAVFDNTDVEVYIVRRPGD